MARDRTFCKRSRSFDMTNLGPLSLVGDFTDIRATAGRNCVKARPLRMPDGPAARRDIAKADARRGCPQWGAVEMKLLKPHRGQKVRHYAKLSPNNEKTCGVTS